MSLRAFVIDDEPLAREGLELRLDDLDAVEVDGSFGRARAALDALRADPPDLLFLDVQMPGLDGFEMLDELAPSERPVFIFVTAYDEYAVRAFEERAVDYLLKPVDVDRLASAVEQARKQIRQQQFAELGPTLRGLLDTLDDPSASDAPAPSDSDAAASRDWIAVRTRGRVIMVRPDEIDYVEGAGDYVELHVGDDTHLHRETMAAIEERLVPHGFQRIHRSTIINLDRVRALDTDRHGAYHVCLEGGLRLKLSRSYRDAFEEAIGTSF
ncbi:LytR/AlgR family response regulator transcription factor [Longibacter sp.]|uniref:LytR/AlgR family response regulator transcription factor n=1 Tax=Longibacter sp. TaxID=2045415 RepID=UPI003EBC1EEB